MRIVGFLRPESIIADLDGRAIEEVRAEIGRPLTAYGLEQGQLPEILLRHERLGSTGIGNGVAIPHGSFVGPRGLFAGFGRSRAGIDSHAIDGIPCRFFMSLLVAQGTAGPDLQALARVGHVFRSIDLRERIYDARNVEDVSRGCRGRFLD